MDGDDYTSDENKRKRTEKDKEPEEIFRRSKKTIRTPQKERKDGDDKIDKLMEMMMEVMKDTKEIKQGQENFRKEMNLLKQENERLKDENNRIRLEMNEMKDKIERLEKNQIKNNIVMMGLNIDTENREDLRNEMENFMEQTIGVKIQVKDAIKIGPKTCKIELNHFQDKQKIMENKNKLKLHRDRIFINNELTKNELEIQRKVIQIAKEEKNNGKIVKIGYQKVYIEGKEWRWDKKEEKLKEILKTGNSGLQAKN